MNNMPDNPNHANFTPTLSGYSGQHPFRFWCQKVLPLIYDDSLSYYELLNKMVIYLNNVISDVASVEGNVEAMLNAYQQLQDYVNNWFENESIDVAYQALDRLAENGELDVLIEPFVAERIDDVVANQIDGAVGEQIDSAVSNWFEEHPESEIPDNSIAENKLVDSIVTKLNNIVTVDVFEAYAETVGEDKDWTNALQRAINLHDTVLVNIPIHIYGTVTVPAFKTIYFSAVQVLKPSTADNTGPLFYLGAELGSLIGSGAGTRIISNVESPNGVIKIGQADDTTPSAKVTKCLVSNLTVHGNGYTTSNVGINICGAEGGNNVTYFTTLQNLYIHDVNKGIRFVNGASASIVNNIVFFHCGTGNKSYDDYVPSGGAFYFERNTTDYGLPMENTIANVFHHQSPNATTIVVACRIQRNRFDNIITEPGGVPGETNNYSRALAVVGTYEWDNTAANVFDFTFNTGVSYRLSDDFLATNRVITHRNERIGSLTANSLTANGGTLTGMTSVDSAAINTPLINLSDPLGIKTINSLSIYPSGKAMYYIRGDNFNSGVTLNFGKPKPYITDSVNNRACVINVIATTYYAIGSASSSRENNARYFVGQFLVRYAKSYYKIEPIGTPQGTLVVEASALATSPVGLHETGYGNTQTLQITMPTFTDSSGKMSVRIYVEIAGFNNGFDIADTENFSVVNR